MQQIYLQGKQPTNRQEESRGRLREEGSMEKKKADYKVEEDP